TGTRTVSFFMRAALSELPATIRNCRSHIMLRATARLLFLLTSAIFVLRPLPAAADASGLLGMLFSNLNIVSVQQEAEISQQLARDIESKNRMLRDAQIEDYVQA